MLATLILMLCTDTVCLEKTPFDQVQAMECAVLAPAKIAAWMNENMPGYRVAGWKCVLGAKRVGA